MTDMEDLLIRCLVGAIVGVLVPIVMDAIGF